MSTAMTRSRKRDRAAKLNWVDRLELSAGRGFERVIIWSMGFWKTGPGQLTLLLTCVVLVALGGLVEKAL